MFARARAVIFTQSLDCAVPLANRMVQERKSTFIHECQSFLQDQSP